MSDEYCNLRPSKPWGVPEVFPEWLFYGSLTYQAMFVQTSVAKKRWQVTYFTFLPTSSSLLLRLWLQGTIQMCCGRQFWTLPMLEFSFKLQWFWSLGISFLTFHEFQEKCICMAWRVYGNDLLDFLQSASSYLMRSKKDNNHYGK